MKAVIVKKYGGPEVLQISATQKPMPRSREILVKISYATVSTGTVLLRRGKVPDSPLFTILMRLIFGITRPRQEIPGVEFSGIVEEVGADVQSFKKGDEVYGTTTGLKKGAYAEYV
ncbi:MAG: alcohol dehydrogenase catalytic domain-containing protein, partial [Chitinophagaceae bacterium]|nr:alcohol dehydrogenase catalytic domain-containing protein [Chitinophagaceae bacterium]